MILEFNRNYFLLTLFLLTIEVIIALFVHDKFIRPYIGDVLVVTLLYCFLKSFIKIRIVTAAVSVLLFSYLVELLQYFNFVHVLGLHESKIARIILGSSFEWLDIVAYTAGFLLVLLFENKQKIF